MSLAPLTNIHDGTSRTTGRTSHVTYALYGNAVTRIAPQPGQWRTCSAAPYLTAQTEACLGTSAAWRAELAEGQYL